MSNLFPLVNLCYRNWFICVDSLIHRRKKRSLSFSLLFALESKKTLMSSTISLRYFLHCVFWHECVDCCSDWIWFRLWILKVITNTHISITKITKDSQKKSSSLSGEAVEKGSSPEMAPSPPSPSASSDSSSSPQEATGIIPVLIYLVKSEVIHHEKNKHKTDWMCN